MSVSKKRRFEVFKRDGFQCAYCGKSPPEITLECDHINPKSKGGTDDINNLITACFDCNRGKRDIPLDKIPSSMTENLEVLKEKELQISEYNKFLKKIDRRLQKEMQQVSDVYTEYFPEYTLNERFRKGTLKKFLKSLPLPEVIDSMRLAGEMIDDSERAIKYFCGICWNKIRGTVKNGQ